MLSCKEGSEMQRVLEGIEAQISICAWPYQRGKSLRITWHKICTKRAVAAVANRAARCVSCSRRRPGTTGCIRALMSNASERHVLMLEAYPNTDYRFAHVINLYDFATESSHFAFVFTKLDMIFPGQFNSEVPRAQDGEIVAELAHRWPRSFPLWALTSLWATAMLILENLSFSLAPFCCKTLSLRGVAFLHDRQGWEWMGMDGNAVFGCAFELFELFEPFVQECQEGGHGGAASIGDRAVLRTMEWPDLYIDLYI